MNTPRFDSLIASIGKAITTAMAYREIVRSYDNALKPTKGKNSVRRRIHKPQPMDANQAVEGPPPSGEISPLQALMHPPNLDFLEDTPTLRQLVELSPDRGASFIKDLEDLRDSPEGRKIRRACREYAKLLDSNMHEAADCAKREVEVVLSGCEDFLSSVLPKQKGYPEILKAIGSGDVTQLDDAVYELRKIESKLKVKADQSENPTSESKMQLWNDADKVYMNSSEAVVQFTDSKMPLPTLSKLLKPDGPMRYMRKGQRSKVHIGDFREYARKKYPSDAEAAEIADEFLADAEARKATEDAKFHLRLKGGKKP